MHGNYFIHIQAIYVANVTYISPISVPYMIKIRAIFQLIEFGKNLKNSDPPIIQSQSTFEMQTFFDYGADPPTFGLFPKFVTFFVWIAPLTHKFDKHYQVGFGWQKKINVFPLFLTHFQDSTFLIDPDLCPVLNFTRENGFGGIKIWAMSKNWCIFFIQASCRQQCNQKKAIKFSKSLKEAHPKLYYPFHILPAKF